MALRTQFLAPGGSPSPLPDGAAARAAFADGPAAVALAAWFGTERLCALLTAPAPGEALASALEADLIALDRRIGDQLDTVLHHPRLRRLEGRWRGLAWLAGRMPRQRPVQLRLLSLSWEQIADDLERGEVGPDPEDTPTDYDITRTHLYRKIHQDEFNMAGGRPFGLLVVDREISHRPRPDPEDRAGSPPTDDLTVIRRLALIGAAAWAPVVVAASPTLLTDNSAARSFAPLGGEPDPASVFDLPHYRRWRRLRGRDEAMFLAVVLPRLLARPPWDDATGRGRPFRYLERADTAQDRVWMSAVWAFAAVVARAMGTYGWPADLRGTDPGRVGGGLVTDLPEEPFPLGPDLTLPRPALDLTLGESQERRVEGSSERGLTAAGLIPLMPLPFGTEPAFGAPRSLHAPSVGGGRVAPLAISHTVSHVNLTLCVGRFAHTIKVVGRDMIGRFGRAETIESELRAWLRTYVNSSPTAGPDLRARRPLRDAALTVREDRDQPGLFLCTVRLVPFFQIDSLASSINFTTEFGTPMALTATTGAVGESA
ncbi:MAG: type secretion system contractile sheath large subunit [Pseudomonadota bacterium]|jgi:type VI secretion system protein ImpD/type VI secretion system protein ImpC